MSFWTDFEAAVKADIVKIEASLASIAKAIKPVVIASAEEVGQAAIQAVLAEAPKVISGQEKAGNAISSVVATIKLNGKSVLASTAETAVQTAFTLISNKINGN